MAIFIYGLADPESKEIRYIGKSERVNQRFKDHLNDKSKTHKVNWITSLRRRGFVPDLVILEEILGAVDWQAREIFWIKKAKELGCRLVNSTDGGDGVLNLSGEGKERMLKTWKGRKHKPETLLKLSAASKGRKKTDASKEKMSAIMKGRKILWAEKLSQAVRKFDQDLLERVKSDLQTMKGKDVAKKYGVHRTTISKIKLGTYPC